VVTGLAGLKEVSLTASLIYRVGLKSKPDNFCNNFVNCLSIFIIFGTNIHCRKMKFAPVTFESPV